MSNLPMNRTVKLKPNSVVNQTEKNLNKNLRFVLRCFENSTPDAQNNVFVKSFMSLTAYLEQQ